MADAAFEMLRKDICDYGDALDYSPWTKEEIDLLADEAAELTEDSQLKGDAEDADRFQVR